MISEFDLISTIWRGAGFRTGALDMLRLTGREAIVPSSFRVVTAAQVTIALAALAAAELWCRRGGQPQRITVDTRAAAAEFRSEHYHGLGNADPRPLWDPTAGVYECGDGRWIRVHTNFRHHRDGLLQLLECEGSRAAIATAVQKWSAEELEKAATEAGLATAMVRSFQEWDRHPQGRAVSALPLVAIDRIGDAPAEGFSTADRPLRGIRVLDLTRIVAGPVCSRTLAAHGADVLRILGPTTPTVDTLDIDTGRGKRSAMLDLRDRDDAERLRRLVRGADVLVQSYRPDALPALGFGPEDVAAIRPGIVYVSVSAYGHAGPWATKRGFDSLVQAASGFNHAEADAFDQIVPRPLPYQALDHGSAYLMAFGAVLGLLKRQEEGGSWHVRVSLARTGQWLRNLGRVRNGTSWPDQTRADIADLLEETPSGYGPLRAVKHAAQMELTPPRWEHPSVPFGTHAPSW
jgi:crotonobetainyl-CoA:carnitine CoA-transferase CaiB-like acyl-CoA transferase